MPETLIAKNIAAIKGFSFSVDSQGRITNLVVNAEVNFGTESRDRSVDIWSDLTVAQKAAAQGIYDRMKSLMQVKFIA